MSPERAQEIWDTRGPFGELSITPEEKAYVNGIWVRMPGHTCFADALLRIARGEVGDQKPMIGSAAFYYGDEIIDQVPVYWGETIEGPEVQLRARRSIEMLGMPANDPVHGCNSRLAKFGNSRSVFYPLRTGQ